VLTRLTIASPQRRVDVALPSGVPVAELLPRLLHHAGEGLADTGEQHGGWMLRRPDGEPLDPSAGLAAAGVLDGEVLHLGPARADWPDLAYDDVVDVIAEGARRQGRAWSPAATRVAGLVAAGCALAVALWLLVDAGAPAAVALGVAAALLLVGSITARAYGDAPAGAALAGFGLPYAFTGGLLLLGAPSMLVGGTALALASVLGAAGAGHGLRVFTAGGTAGALVALAALLADTAAVSAVGAAAALLAVVVAGAAGLPLAAIRLGRLPMPVLGPEPAPPPDRARVHAAVARTDEILTGLLAGFAAAALAASTVLARASVAAQVLVAVAAVAFLLRARLFATIRQRVPLLVAGAAGLGLLAVAVGTVAVAAGLAVAGLLVALAGARYARQAPSPYAGRAADLLDALCVVSVVPLAAAVLGLYPAVRDLVG